MMGIGGGEKDQDQDESDQHMTSRIHVSAQPMEHVDQQRAVPDRVCLMM